MPTIYIKKAEREKRADIERIRAEERIAGEHKRAVFWGDEQDEIL